MTARATWLVLLLSLGTPGLRAQEGAAAPVTDPVVVKARLLALEQRPQFRDLDQFSGGMHWSDWASQWLTHLVSRFRDFKYAGQMSQLAWVLVVAMAVPAVLGVVYVLRRLSRRRREETPDEDLAPLNPQTRLSPTQYEDRLRRALEGRDWHGAWLAAWLQLLARLEQRQLVETDRSLTNREYLARLRARPLPPSALPLLAKLVDDYDRFIYGLRVIDEAGWSAFHERIDEVTLLLNLREVTTGIRA